MLLGRDQWAEIFQTMRRNRLRTLLTACGVFWGVFMLMVMLGFGRGLEKGATRDFGTWARNTVFVFGDRTTKAHAGRQPGRKINLTMDDVAEVRARTRGVELVLPRVERGDATGLVSRGEKNGAFNVSGDEPDYLRLESLEFSSGRFINPDDMAQARKVAVIGPRVREKLFDPGEEPVGQRVQIGQVSFTVIGVYEVPNASGNNDWLTGRIFVPRTTFARTFGTGVLVNYLAILVSPERPSIDVENEVKAALRKRHGVHPDDTRGLGSFNREKNFRKVSNLFLGITTLTWTVGVLTLLAGAIGVSNIMMIAVAERTREIGIRKALGATPLAIMVQIVAEAVVLTAVAGYLGLVMGVAVLEIAARVVESMPAGSGPKFFAAPEIDLTRAGAAAVLLTLAGALAGLAPARSAVAVRPVEALAHE